MAGTVDWVDIGTEGFDRFILFWVLGNKPFLHAKMVLTVWLAAIL